MKYQDFITNVADHVASQLHDNQQVQVKPVTRNNGIVYEGLFILDPILNVSPTIYLNPYYHRFLSGVSLDDIYADILNTYYANLPKTDFDATIFTDFNKAKSRIVMKLVNRQRNTKLLEKIPYIPFLDLAIVFVCTVTDCLNEYATILIHNEHLNLWNITPSELYRIAVANSPTLLPYQFENINTYADNYPCWLDEIEVYILTNQPKIHGACCMLYPGLLDEIASQLDSDLVIIPSSIHEVLIIPETYLDHQEQTPPDFSDIIREVNDTELSDDEVLGDRAYYYRRSSGTIEF